MEHLHKDKLPKTFFAAKKQKSSPTPSNLRALFMALENWTLTRGSLPHKALANNPSDILRFIQQCDQVSINLVMTR